MTFKYGTSKRINRISVGLFSMVLVSVSVSDAGAGSTQVWVQETYADFNAGEGDGVEVVSTGHLRPGMLFEQKPLKGVSMVFSILETPRGVVMGTGDAGEVWLHDGKKETMLAALEGAVVVTDLLPWRDGKILAATLPDGKIFSVDLKTGKTEVFVQLEAKHVWSIVRDPKNNDVYAGTGPEGKLFRITPAGKAEVFWDSPEEHILSMSYGPGGLYVGTAPKAIVYRVLGRGKVRAIHDFDGTEIRSLKGNDRVLYAAVNKMEPPKVDFPKVQAVKGKGTPIKKRKLPAKKAVRKIPRKGARKGKGGVFRIWETGAAEQLHGLDDSYFTALEITPDDNVYAAEGKRGQVFFLARDGRLSTVVDVKERQVLALSISSGISCFGTGDGGVFYRRRKAGRRQYQSEVLDAKAASRWGRIEWRGSGNVRVDVRTGNTSEADDTWSEWMALRKVSPIVLGNRGMVPAPSGRYFQYRISWPTGGGARAEDRVEGLKLYFVPVNRRAVITEIKVADQKSQDKKSGIAKAPWLKKVTANAPSEMKIEWTVSNPDGDPLWYFVSYRAMEQTEWIPLGGDEPLTATNVTWPTGSIPDGLYMISVTASDERSNPRDTARTHTLVTGPYLVDNTKPRFRDLVIKYPMVRGTVEDDMSRITGIQYSLNGKTWYPVDPEDGVFDDRVERFSFRVPEELVEKSRSGIILLRAFDEAGNAVVETRNLVVKRGGGKKAGR